MTSKEFLTIPRYIVSLAIGIINFVAIICTWINSKNIANNLEELKEIKRRRLYK